MEINDSFFIVVLQVATLFFMACMTLFFWVQNERTKVKMESATVELEKKLQTLPARLNKSMKQAFENMDFEEMIPELIPDQPSGFWTSLMQALPYIIQGLGGEGGLQNILGGFAEGAMEAGAQVIHEETQEKTSKK